MQIFTLTNAKHNEKFNSFSQYLSDKITDAEYSIHNHGMATARLFHTQNRPGQKWQTRSSLENTSFGPNVKIYISRYIHSKIQSGDVVKFFNAALYAKCTACLVNVFYTGRPDKCVYWEICKQY